MRGSLIITIAAVVLGSTPLGAQPRGKAAATQADIDRLEKKLEDQQRVLDGLLRAQLQYAQAIAALLSDKGDKLANDKLAGDKPAGDKLATDKPADKPKPIDKPRSIVRAPKLDPNAKQGSVVGKITGASDAVVYVDGMPTLSHGTASMRQEGKQFVPGVLVVQRGTQVAFPNRDAFFHNVFSVTPDNSFDLGSYRMGESKSVTLSKPGVVSVYCNMHPQMVGHILVVPNALYTNVSSDGSFKIANVPVGHHRIVAWAPNSRPVVTEVDVAASAAATVQLEVKVGHASPHTNKDGLPYGSYK